MSGVQLQFTVNDTAVRQWLTDMQSKFSPAQKAELMDEMGQALVSDTTDRFERGVDPAGNPWIPSQRAIAKNGKTLIDKDNLWGGITNVFSTDDFTVGSGEIYAGIHQEGGMAGRNLATEIVPRPFLGLEQPQQNILEDVWLGWLEA